MLGTGLWPQCSGKCVCANSREQMNDGFAATAGANGVKWPEWQSTLAFYTPGDVLLVD